jgi:hypothetical protein
MMEAEVEEVVGPKGNPDRAAVRHGHDDGDHLGRPPRGCASPAREDSRLRILSAQGLSSTRR